MASFNQLLAQKIIDKGLASSEEVNRLLKEASSTGRSLEDLLYVSKIVGERDIVNVKADILSLPVKFFESGEQIGQEYLSLIPEESARHYKFIPFFKKENELYVALANPNDTQALEALKFTAKQSGLKLRIFLASLPELETALSQYKSFKKELGATLEEIRQELPELKKASRFIDLEAGLTSESAPIIKLVSSVIKKAVESLASDIHIESEKDRLRVRFRVDGVLQTVLYLPISIHGAVVSRVKVLSDLKLDETRVPQDGRFNSIVNEREIDFRVSTFPTATGEKAELRVLDPSVGLRKIADIALSSRNREILEESLERPYGMILATGPTGSGKTTTLYAILGELNNESVNILSLEDPVEYTIDGVNQSQVFPEIGYTFANGLRHIVRQDPDIILVGEIRDGETADLAINAALTGHLMLSTLHTNNAIGAIPRLLDLGIKNFFIPPSLIVIIGQRLIAMLCQSCKKVKKTPAPLLKMLEPDLKELNLKEPIEFFESLGCEDCLNKGRKGRIGLFEFLKMTPELGTIVLKEFDESEVVAEAKRQGMITMRQDGIQKAMQGLVAIEDVIQETT